MYSLTFIQLMFPFNIFLQAELAEYSIVMSHTLQFHTGTPGLYTVQGNIKMPNQETCFLKHSKKIVVTCPFYQWKAERPTTFLQD